MNDTAHTLELDHEPAPLTWLDQASAEIATLQAAAKTDHKAFYGNRQRGIGAGSARVGQLLRAVKGLEQALHGLDRGM